MADKGEGGTQPKPLALFSCSPSRWTEMLLDVHCSCVSPALYASVQVLQQWGEEHKYNKASEEAMSCVLTIPSHTQWCEILKYFDAREHDLVSLLQLSLQLYCWSIVGNILYSRVRTTFSLIVPVPVSPSCLLPGHPVGTTLQT